MKSAYLHHFFANPLTLALLCLAAPTFAQSTDTRISELERKLERSLAVIEQLSQRIKQLEQPAAKFDDPINQNTRIEAVEQQVAQIVKSGAQKDETASGIEIHGFADVGAGLASAGPRKGFSVGSLDLYMTPRLGERTKALVELVFETGPGGGTAAELERVQVGYTFSDAATLWLGRFHTPIGYYNTAFHHGQQIATSLRRPRFVDFEDFGGILPVHSIGLWLVGHVPAADGKLTYDFWGSNSPSISGGDLTPNAGGSTNHHMSIGANIGYEFGESLDGLKLGMHLLSARVDDDLTPRNTTTLNTYGMYAVYDTENWENILELYHFRNRDETGGTGVHTSNAGFVQLGYRMDPFTPYARFERTALDQTDNYFSGQNQGISYKRFALGLRYDLDLTSALKFEFAPTRDTDRVPLAYREALMQYSIRF